MHKRAEMIKLQRGDKMMYSYGLVICRIHMSRLRRVQGLPLLHKLIYPSRHRLWRECLSMSQLDHKVHKSRYPAKVTLCLSDREWGQEPLTNPPLEHLMVFKGVLHRIALLPSRLGGSSHQDPLVPLHANSPSKCTRSTLISPKCNLN
jgi:hypothetical protein